MLSVHQHWDPLKVCAVGRSYPPEFYSFVKNPRVRNVLERIAIETEEDYQKIIKLLEKFNVKVIRTDISDNFEDYFDGYKYYQPPMCPRDHTMMLGNNFFMPGENFGGVDQSSLSIDMNYGEILDLEMMKKFPKEQKEEHIKLIKESIRKEPLHTQKILINNLKESLSNINHDPLSTFPINKKFNSFGTIEKYIKEQGNNIFYDKYMNSACVTRLGKDVYYGTVVPNNDIGLEIIKRRLRSLKKEEFLKDYRFHIVNCGTHSDGCYCPVKPGLIISLRNIQNYEKTFPDWEVVSIPGQSWDKVSAFLELKNKNKGKWWVPGEELNDDFTDFVETWLNDWVLYVEETVFDVNMLVIDEKNVICNNYNKKIFDAFDRHGITAHVINFRHRYFWDGGIHCITSDLDREGTQKDFFPERN
jgi:hypothetical protein